MTPVIRWFFVWLGFSATCSQVFLTREILVVSEGNEASLGIVLASWLICSALGSFLGGRFRARFSPRWLAGGTFVVGMLLPPGLYALRSIRWASGLAAGELLGAHSLVFWAFLLLGPICFLYGSMFALSARYLSVISAQSPGRAASSVYSWEAFGSAAGGLVAAALLLPLLDTFEAALVLTASHCVIALFLLEWSRVARFVILLALGSLCFWAVLAGLPGRVEWSAISRSWRGWQVSRTANSPYGSIALLRRDDLTTMFFNGVPLFSVPDEESAEQSVHYALLQHPDPRSVLIIGSTGLSSLRHALSHPQVRRLDFVELDRVLLRVTEEVFAQEWSELRSDGRVRAYHSDPRLFVRASRSMYDVVIMNLPDPRTAQLNRFYTLEFFQEVHAALRPRGVFSFQVSGSENYLGQETARYLQCVSASLGSIFPEVTAFPGSTIHFFAGKSGSRLTRDSSLILERLESRNLRTSYVDRYHLPFRLMPDRLADLDPVVSSTGGVLPNRDFQPTGYFHAMVARTSVLDPSLSEFLRALGDVRYGFALAAVSLCSVMLILIAHPLKPPTRSQLALGVAVGSMGMLMMGLQVLLLFGFQVILGAVYYHISALIAAFMAGMGLGSLLGSHRAASGGMITRIQLAGTIWPVVLTELLLPVSRLSEFWLVYLFFLLASVGTGFLGGFHFPLANALRRSLVKRPQSTGTLYGIDLLGAALAAIALGSWFLPVYGFSKTAWLLTLSGVGPLVLLVRETRAPERR